MTLLLRVSYQEVVLVFSYRCPSSEEKCGVQPAVDMAALVPVVAPGLLCLNSCFSAAVPYLGRLWRLQEAEASLRNVSLRGWPWGVTPCSTTIQGLYFLMLPNGTSTSPQLLRDQLCSSKPWSSRKLLLQASVTVTTEKCLNQSPTLLSCRRSYSNDPE